MTRALALDNITNYAFDGSIAVGLYDFMFHDTNDVKPASSMADQGTEAANQVYFAARFAGVAMDARTTDSPADTDPGLPVAKEFRGVFTCASSTFEIGDFVGVKEDAGGTFLTNDTLAKVTNATEAIGKATKRYASATTSVEVLLTERVQQPPALD